MKFRFSIARPTQLAPAFQIVVLKFALGHYANICVEIGSENVCILYNNACTFNTCSTHYNVSPHFIYYKSTRLHTRSVLIWSYVLNVLQESIQNPFSRKPFFLFKNISEFFKGFCIFMKIFFPKMLKSTLRYNVAAEKI